MAREPEESGEKEGSETRKASSSSNAETKKKPSVKKRIRAIGHVLIVQLMDYYHRDYIPGDTYRYVFQKNLDIRRSYIYYRFAICLAHAGLLLVVLFNVFSPCPPDTKKEYTDCLSSWSRLYTAWPFYLTNCGLSVNFLQSVVGLALTIRAYGSQKSSKLRNVTPSFLRAKNEHILTTATGIFWSLNTAATILAVIIDLSYWIAVHIYSEKVSPLLINTLSGHLFNLVVLVIDKCLVAFPVMFSHVLVLLVIELCYVIMNLTYFSLGGLDRSKEKRYLYKFLDWEEPLRCLLVVALLLIFSMLLIEPIMLGDSYKHTKFRPQQIYEAYKDTIDGLSEQNKKETSPGGQEIA